LIWTSNYIYHISLFLLSTLLTDNEQCNKTTSNIFAWFYWKKLQRFGEINFAMKRINDCSVFFFLLIVFYLKFFNTAIFESLIWNRTLCSFDCWRCMYKYRILPTGKYNWERVDYIQYTYRYTARWQLLHREKVWE